MPSGPMRSSTPVRTGRVSSRDAARATRSIASVRGSDGSVSPEPSSAGSSGKSWACRQFRENDEPPPVIWTIPSLVRCSSVTGPSAMLRTMSPARRGSTTAPGSSAVASSGTRSDSSMSVEASSQRPSSARSSTWERIWMVLFADATRAAVASLPASSSFGETRRTARP